ncbi:hypothetical protein EDB80DRAFT_685327 [Ilyonectria destructans]|nr:hypothetical protein EDB80DRAFT_685327 [Ilyonectria destructans]
MDEYVERSDLENPHLGPDAEELDAITAAQFVKQKFGTELAQLLVTSAIRTVIGVEPDELSELFFVDYLKSPTGLRNIISDTTGGGQYLTNRQEVRGVNRAGLLVEDHPCVQEPWSRAANLSGGSLSENGPIVLTRDMSVIEDNQYSIATFQVGQPPHLAGAGYRG